MAKDLNLALKKEVFESLQNGTTNEIIIEGSRWWKKRLMDLDTGRFKDFTVARVSSGSSDKVEYEIVKIEQRGENFVVTVYVSTPENTPVTPDEGEQPCVDNGDSDSDFDDEPIQYSDGAVHPIHTVTDGNDEGIEITGIKGTQEDLLKPDGVNPVTVETDENGDVVFKATYVKPILEITQKFILKKTGEMLETEIVDDDEPEVIPGDEPEENINTEQYKNLLKVDNNKLKSAVTNLFNKFCELSSVYVVNMPNVTIRNNGQIFGSNRKLIADRDSDVRFEFTKKEFVKNSNTSNTSFIVQIMTYLSNLMKNNYVFVNKNMSGFRESEMGNLIFTVTAVAKRKYFFEKK